MAKTPVPAANVAANTRRVCGAPHGKICSAGNEAGDTDARSNSMNMMTAIEAPISSRPKLYIDETGAPSDRFGPDLSKATPIEEVLKQLAHRKTGDSGTYSTAFYQAARDSGIYLSTGFNRDGSEYLSMGLPCDSQEDMRRERYDALRAHVGAKPSRRQSVIYLLNILGFFVDNRPFASVEAAADAWVEAGGRIYALVDGTCEETFSIADNVLEDSWNGYPLRRLKQRYDVTLRAKGARGQLAAIVRAKGHLYEGSGAHVLETQQACQEI
jgi:hypothetical protein